MKKRVNGAWEDDSGYIASSTHVDYTSFPIAIEPTYTPLNVVISGNMTQTGTPTPEDPIQPQECGDLETTGEHTGQYKIPILSNSTTTNVYLGEVQSTRRIKKLVLTGEESFVEVGSGGVFRLTLNGYLRESANIPYCTHYEGEAPVEGASQVHDLHIAFLISGSGNNYMYIRDDNYTGSASNFKAYLAQQYANGTPVTVWYVLETPTTGIVNEPLRKIGDYADEVFVKIPVTIGEDTIDISTTIKPSKLSVLSIAWNSEDDYKRSDGAWA